jgi:hypothetical protein
MRQRLGPATWRGAAHTAVVFGPAGAVADRAKTLAELTRSVLGGGRIWNGFDEAGGRRMSVVLRVLGVWLALNALIVAVWAWIGWFARRARSDVRRRRAEVAFTTLGVAAILASLSLINPGIRSAVSPIVNTALGLTRTHESRPVLGVPGIATGPFGSPGPAPAPTAASRRAPRETGPRGSQPDLSTPILARRIHGEPAASPSPAPTPAACPSDQGAPTGPTGPSPGPDPCPSPSPSPSPEASPAPSP